MKPISIKRFRGGGGFTLIELLVVIAILLALAGLVFSLAGKAIDSAKEQRNMNQLRNLGGYVTSYAGEYGHLPPGRDPLYTEEGYGPPQMQWQLSRDRYPDILNAFIGNTSPSNFFLSPTAGTKLNRNASNYQPTNYIGHPALIWDGQDREALEALGSPPFTLARVRRPSEVFLFTDGASIEGNTPARNCGETVRRWVQNGTVTIDNPGLARTKVDLESRGNGKYGSVDFRNRGKAHVLFCDGSVRLMAPDDWRVRNVSLGF